MDPYVGNPNNGEDETFLSTYSLEKIFKNCLVRTVEQPAGKF